MDHSFDLQLFSFLSKRAVFCSTYEFSLLNYYIFCPSSCYHGQFPKCSPAILIENCDQAICLGLSILFLYATAHKVWLFEMLFLS